MDNTLAAAVLKEAIEQYGIPKILNLDADTKNNGIQISMNGKSRSIDNIAIERFFRILKHSNIYISDYGLIK